MQVPKDRLLTALQTALVNFVAIVGVDINRAMRDDYYSVLLPFVAGLGARKASGMVRRIKAVVSDTSQSVHHSAEKQCISPMVR